MIPRLLGSPGFESVTRPEFEPKSHHSLADATGLGCDVLCDRRRSAGDRTCSA